MYCATTGTFLQRDPLGQPGSPELLYSDEYVANQLRNRRTDAEAAPDLINLYAYVSNNPINMTDPSGLIGYGGPPGRQLPRKGPPMVCGFYAWLYAGSGVIPNLGTCVPQDVYDAALDAAGGVVNCWWECEVKTHKCVGGQILTVTETVSGAVGSLGVTIPKEAGELLANQGKYGVARSFQLANREQLKSLLRPLLERQFGHLRGRAIGRSALVAGAKGVFVITALVEAGISISCGYSCSK